MGERFNVSLRGQPFTLYRDQIEFDAPNYFSALFLGEFAESQTRTVHLSRSPELFRILVDYMSGYNVLPLAPSAIPATMTVDTALDNLQRDAEFYGLQRLVLLLRRTPSVTTVIAAYRAFGVADATVPLEDLLAGNLPPGVTLGPKGVGTASDGTWRPVAVKASGLLLTSVTSCILCSCAVLTCSFCLGSSTVAVCSNFSGRLSIPPCPDVLGC